MTGDENPSEGPSGGDTAQAPPDLIGALARTRVETARLVRSIDAHRDQSELLLREINRQELDIVRLLRGLTSVLDMFERLLDNESNDTLETYRAGVRRTAELLLNVLDNNSGIELVGRRGEIADPATHNVVEVRDEDGLPEDTVIKVVERGLRYRGELLRPASVIVSSGKGTPS